MSHPESSLPDPWVERIWATMRATYGAAFDRQWECPAGVDPLQHVQQLKGHWGRELRGFQQNPAAIGYALDNLPENPPNLVQFRQLCTRRPEPQQKALPAPKADPARVQSLIAGMSRQIQQRSGREWAYALREQQRRGKILTPAVAEMVREALRVELSENRTEAT